MRTSNFDIFAAVDGLRQQFGGSGFMSRVSQGGDTRSAILGALADGPKNGFEIIQAINGKPADVYPTLQLLADEGLVTAAQDGERKVYSLTDAGKAATTDSPTESSNRMALPKSGAKLASAVGQVMQNGSAEQQEKAVAVLDDARRKLYALLAED